MEDEGTDRTQLERYSSVSPRSSSRNKVDKPPQYEKIQVNQAGGSRLDKKQMVNEAVDKIYDRAQYEVDHIPASKLPAERLITDKFASDKLNHYDKPPRGSITKSFTDASYKNHLKDKLEKYDRLDKNQGMKKVASDIGRRDSGRQSKSAATKDSKSTGGEVAFQHGVCRCAAMGGRPHVHRSIDDKWIGFPVIAGNRLERKGENQLNTIHYDIIHDATAITRTILAQYLRSYSWLIFVLVLSYLGECSESQRPRSPVHD
ncbi:uncharacterized protein [Cherax quadricarinatus]|uniref:uncharacterized protein n=1 Tax=Cherax quadricarinatus TaxID=27406 RepID=UPI00387E2FD0